MLWKLFFILFICKVEFQVQLSTLEKAGLVSSSDTSKDVKFLINYYLSGKVCIRAGKSKSLIRWKRLKGGKRRKKAEKANLIYN